jgi:hypothetical protein
MYRIDPDGVRALIDYLDRTVNTGEASRRGPPKTG